MLPNGPLADRLHSRLQLLARETVDPYTLQLGGYLVASVSDQPSTHTRAAYTILYRLNVWVDHSNQHLIHAAVDSHLEIT